MITSLNINDDSITGRLGNKLFIIAAMVGYTLRHTDSFILPKWQYADVFPNIHTTDYPIDVNCRYQEPHFHYYEIPYHKNYNMSLHGYFQSEKYFAHCREATKYYLSPNDSIKKLVDEKWKVIQKAVNTDKTVLVQVRAGLDYDNDYHGILPMRYFEEAFKQFPDHTFIMFSDDIEKCKHDFKRNDIYFVDNTNPIVDMFLSAKCNNAIIPNSSFSWWSAWFIDNEDKKVIAPKAWFGPRGGALNDTKDLYMEDWLIL